MKCEGYGHIQVECSNTWSDDEYEACNEGEDICNELVAPISLSTTKRGLSDLTNSGSSPLVDPSTYESPASMNELGLSDVVIIDVTNGVESNDDEEIFDEEMTYSYKSCMRSCWRLTMKKKGCSSKSLNCVERKMSSSNNSMC